MLWAIPALKGTALTKSLPTMNTGSLIYLSLSPGLVVPYNSINIKVVTAKSTVVAENVKFPNLGTATPLPFLNYFAMYEPKPFQITLTVFSSNAPLLY